MDGGWHREATAMSHGHTDNPLLNARRGAQVDIPIFGGVNPAAGAGAVPGEGAGKGKEKARKQSDPMVKAVNNIRAQKKRMSQGQGEEEAGDSRQERSVSVKESYTVDL
jgi:hypothetical protein